MTSLELSLDPVLGAGLVAAVVLALLLLAVGWWRARHRVRRANARRSRLAARGEQRAEQLLITAGYRVVDRQVYCTDTMSVDGEACQIAVRVDLIVRKRRRRYIAEVKTGAVAPDPTHPATRRQLREYKAFFPDHGLLLVDAEGETIHEIHF